VAPLKAIIPPILTDDPIAWSVSVSVTLVHPAKAVGRNEMPFGRDTWVVPSNTVLEGPRSSHRKGRFGRLYMGSNPQSQFASQIVTEVLQIEELLPQTAYRNSATPYPKAPPVSPYAPFLQFWGGTNNQNFALQIAAIPIQIAEWLL